MALLNDHWTLDLDDMQATAAADSLSELVLNCRPPFAIAVHGKWGSGKTSIMRHAMARLGGYPLSVAPSASAPYEASEIYGPLESRWTELRNGSPTFVREQLKSQLHASCADALANADTINILCVWFNAWQNQNCAAPMVALLQELRRQATFAQRFSAEAQKLTQVAVETALSTLGRLTLLSRIPVEHAENVGHIARRDHRLVAERAARQPESERTCDGESDGCEGVGEVALRPRARPHEGHFAVRSRGGNAASALR